MIVLGIETRCDETAAAMISDDREILSNIVLSQHEHEAYGGVVPEVAARAHLEHIDRIVLTAMEKVGVDFNALDGVAVTSGPGLIGGVMVGVMTAKAIAAAHDLPCIAVNHLEGHALTARLTNNIAFPYLLLLVSGGHSQILIVNGVGDYTRLGTTIDDAVGEAFDKTAKLLGLGYPGGPAVEQMAAQCMDIKEAHKKFPLPKPLVGRPGCDFSFSGLKTAVRRHCEQSEAMPDEDKSALCAVFQDTVAKVMTDRLCNAIKICRDKDIAPRDGKPMPLVVAGGVAANTVLRQALADCAMENGLDFQAPPIGLCADNAAMIAWAGIEYLTLGHRDPLDFAARPRWPLDPDAPPAIGAGIKA